jgi:hypothetical protein
MRSSGFPVRRVVHGLLGAVLCLLFAGAGHIAAGGRLPGPGWLTVAFLPLAAVGVGLAGKRRGFDVIAVVAGMAQFAVHLVFHYAAVPSAHAHAHHHAHHAEPAITFAAMMWHGIAGLTAALCVAYGEWLVRRLAALVVRTFLWRLAPSPFPASRLRPRISVALPALHGQLLARVVSRRGPPRLVPA